MTSDPYFFKITLAYDGTSYFGWQKTRMGPSIQEELQKALYALSSETILPEAASRTDRGVHAEGQIVHFGLKKPFTPFRLQEALNAHLPAAIRVMRVEPSSSAFHPTLQASAKRYDYRVCLGPVQEPIYRLTSWHIHKPLDVEIMRRAAKDFLGTYDFTALANEKEKNPFCTLTDLEIAPLPDNRLQISLYGNRFLYKMARNLVGTLVYIGLGKLPPSCIPALLASRDRKQGGVTAPPHGLFLTSVFYTG